MIAGRYRVLLLGLVMLMIAGGISTQAQSQVTISVAVPEFFVDLVRDNITRPFEELNPDVRVNLVTASPPNYNLTDMNGYLDDFEEYASAADILIMSESNLSLETTRAGYLLDLAPLVRSDSALNPNDFYPVMWDSYQWDGGMWAIPVAGDVIGLLYDPAAFDSFGVFYPDEFWTLNDFENAIRSMSEVDSATGKITKSVYLDFTSYGNAGILLSLSGEPLFDPTSFDSAPDFTNPVLEELITEWKRLYDDGLFPPITDSLSLDLNAPLTTGPSLFAAISLPGMNVSRKLVSLPGGHSQISVNGLGISAGSLYPEEAYRLIKYATETPATATAFLSAVPARKSLAGVEADMEGSNLLSSFISVPSPELIADLQRLMENSYPQSQVLFTPYLAKAIQEVISGEKDVQTALQDAEVAAQDNIQLAEERTGNFSITVATPPPDVNLSEGEIEISFGIESLIGTFPNESDWRAAADEFVGNDSQVASVKMEPVSVLSGNSLETITEKYDCFYQSSNIVPTADLSKLLAIDPLIASDFAFDANNVVGGALNQLRRENQLWGIPLSIRPEAFFYNPTMFSINGAFEPYPGWTTGDFETALRTLKVSPNDPIPYIPRDMGGGTYLLLLMAAYGGLPIDYSTTPPTINFTEDSSIQAIQQVLDLAKDGYIKYTPLAGSNSALIALGSEEEASAMYSELLNALQDLGGINIEATDSGDSYLMTMFPQGTAHTVAAYELGAGYVSANTPYAEACYRFLVSLMDNTSLFSAMPVLRSVINSPELVTSSGQAAVEYYQAMDNLISTQGAVVFNTGLNTSVGGEALVSTWLFRVFDKYIASDNVDLPYELSEAQLFAGSYLECLSLIPQEESTGDLIARYRKWRDCAVKVDPSMESAMPAF